MVFLWRDSCSVAGHGPSSGKGAVSERQRIAEATKERRHQEDRAARLLDTVPELRSLALAVDEFTSTGEIPLRSYRKLVVVARAPALFALPCGDTDCRDGGYDLTREILTALRRREASFSGAGTCWGQRWNERCARRLAYEAVATYQPPST